MKKTPKLIFKVREPGQHLVPSFRGPYFIWYCNYSTDGYSGFSDDFVVLSSGRRQTVHRKLWLKLLYDELSFEEFSLFLSMPETLKNDKIVGFLRARLEVPKTKLRQRLIVMESLIGDKPSLRESYLGIQRVRIDIRLERRKLRKTPKFSGYIKNNSRDKGGRLGGATTVAPVISNESEILENLFSKEIDWYEILTVGEITLLSQSFTLPDESLKIKTKQ